jgi:hypothetical protein
MKLFVISHEKCRIVRFTTFEQKDRADAVLFPKIVMKTRYYV